MRARACAGFLRLRRCERAADRQGSPANAHSRSGNVRGAGESGRPSCICRREQADMEKRRAHLTCALDSGGYKGASDPLSRR